MSTTDPGARLEDLLEESSDIHSDAMRTTGAVLSEIVETGKERRSAEPVDLDERRAVGEHLAGTAGRLSPGVLPPGALAAGVGLAAAFGAGLLALSAQAALAGTPGDIQLLQTQASIENLAVATYGVALGLPFIGGASAVPVVKAFVTQTKAQHAQHAAAFNSAIKTLGGTQQMSPDPVLLKIVDAAKPGLTGPGAVVKLALELENGAAETYVKNVSAFADSASKQLTASIMGVEAQHVAVLLAVQALVSAGAASDITLPPPVATLPAAAGSVGFPNSFYSTTLARPAAEGAVS